MENQIDEKYLKEIGDKYKYKVNEMNEKIIVLNHETKKVIIDTAVENTIYNSQIILENLTNEGISIYQTKFEHSVRSLPLKAPMCL